MRPPRLSKNSKYSVELRPLGYSCRPSTEEEMRRAVRAVLQALMVMHGQGFVHRDVRWENLLRDGQVGQMHVIFSLALSPSV